MNTTRAPGQEIPDPIGGASPPLPSPPYKSIFDNLLPLVFIVLVLFMGFYNLGGTLMNDDEGTYLYGAWRVSLGEAPYQDFFVSQTPLSFYLAAPLFKIFGPTVWGARALSFLLILGTAFLIYFMSHKFFKFNKNLSLFAAAVFLFTKHIYFLGRMFMPDSFMIFFAAAALAFALKAEAGAESGPAALAKMKNGATEGINDPLRRNSANSSLSVFLFGAFVGLATLAKLNAILVFGGYILYLFFACLFRRPAEEPALPAKNFFSKALFASAGFLLTFGVAYVLMLVFVPGTYRATLGFHLAKEKSTVVRYAALPILRLAESIGNHNYGLVPMALAGLFFAPFFKDKKRALLFFVMLAVLAQIFIPGVFYLRYILFALVPLAFFFGDGIIGIGSWKRTKYFVFPLAAALLLLSLGPTFNLKKLRAYDQDTRTLAAYVRDRTPADAYVFGDDPGINFLARRACPPRLVDVSGGMTRSGQVTAADIRTECERYKVKLIFVEKGESAHHLRNLKDYGLFRAYLEERYEFVQTLPREFLQVDIYRRKTIRNH